MLTRAKFIRDARAVLLWIVTFLILLDACVGILFRPPADARVIPSPLQMYFEYGRSMEGKLRHMVGATAAEDALIVGAGWIARECGRSNLVPADKIGVEIYGMSHSNRVADQLAKQDPGLAVEHIGGPAAPLNHSYACFVQRDEAKLARAPIQIIGVLAGSVRRALTITGLTTSFEQPMPFTYPRYRLSDDRKLLAYWPTIQSPEDLRAALAQPEEWRTFLGELQEEDVFYAPELFSADFLDHSAILRMIRRAWAQRIMRNRTASLHPETGFDGAPNLVAVMQALLIDFANRARASRRRPIVLLFEDRGFGGALSKMLEPTLRANHIDFVSSASFAPADDPSKFLPDGHFTSTVDAQIAHAVLQLLGRAP
jgi:hypothetical protein